VLEEQQQTPVRILAVTVEVLPLQLLSPHKVVVVDLPLALAGQAQR
jgi:hypothetical protein